MKNNKIQKEHPEIQSIKNICDISDDTEDTKDICEEINNHNAMQTRSKNKDRKVNKSR